MRKIDLQICNCEFLVGMTYCDTFASLDHQLVDSANKLTFSTYAALFIGDYSETNDDCQLLAQSYADESEPDHLPRETKIIPINLPSGRLLSLLINCDENEKQLSELLQLLTVYQNQHEHLNRANKDKLTTLKNRRAFDNEYQILTNTHMYCATGHILAVLDIDFFKNVNDKYGHLIGDETLIAVSNLMKEFFQREDHLYRFGGEEFIILLHSCTIDDATKLLNELRERIAEHTFAQIGQITVSIGFIQLETGVDNNLLFERADAALYYTKASGRNCVANYEQLIEQKLIAPIIVREGEIELF